MTPKERRFAKLSGAGSIDITCINLLQLIPVNRKPLLLLLSAHALLAATTITTGINPAIVSAADIIKCRSRTGQIIYSDVPCEKQGASSIGTVDATPNVVGAIRPTQPEPQGAATSDAAKAPDSSQRAISTNKPRVRDAEALRIREHELGVITQSMVSTPEQKSAAQEELASIRTLGVCKLTNEQRTRRDGAYSDLGSLVKERRLRARGVISQILSTCERG
jgi:hypothetical protein